MINNINKAMKPLYNKLNMLIGKALLSSLNNGQMLNIKLTGLDNDTIDDVEMPQQYGIASRPPAGSEVVYASVGGNRDSAIALIVSYSKEAPNDLSPGDTVVWDIHGNKIKLTSTGIELISVADTKIQSDLVITGDITVSGKAKITGNIDSLGIIKGLQVKDAVNDLSTHFHSPLPSPALPTP